MPMMVWSFPREPQESREASSMAQQCASSRGCPCLGAKAWQGNVKDRIANEKRDRRSKPAVVTCSAQARASATKSAVFLQRLRNGRTHVCRSHHASRPRTRVSRQPTHRHHEQRLGSSASPQRRHCQCSAHAGRTLTRLRSSHLQGAGATPFSRTAALQGPHAQIVHAVSNHPYSRYR